MQVSSKRRLAAGAAASLALLAAAGPVAAQHGAHGSAAAKADAPELGSSAAVDAQGRLWLAAKESTPQGQFVTVRSSSDLGKTWSDPVRVQSRPEPVSAEGENRPKIAFAPNGAMVITYTRPLAKPYTGEIRLVRSPDGGRRFLAPVTVHANRDVITHRFDSLIIDRAGRVYVAWIDKRDLEQARRRGVPYRGAAIYYTVSDDGGASFKGDFKIADHSCECCRIALALDPAGKVTAMWRHVFAPNVRDHALAVLGPDGKAGPIERATFDDWRIDACPHHGPALAFDAGGRRYQAWFNGGDDGGVLFGQFDRDAKPPRPTALGSAQAAHAEVAVQGERVVLAWKQFDGQATAILGRISADRGRTWTQRELARTAGHSDQPRLLTTPAGILLVWHTQQDGVRVLPTVTPGGPS
jgi:hypothetical protein